LIDYKAYAEKHDIKYSPFESHSITVADIEAIAQEQDVGFRQGDVIIIRTGFTEALGKASHGDQQKMLGTERCAGVAQSRETVKWFWNQHFAAVASDNAGFEVLPPLVDGQNIGTPQDMRESSLGSAFSPSQACAAGVLTWSQCFIRPFWGSSV
jgi:hypothetical protein